MTAAVCNAISRILGIQKHRNSQNNMFSFCAYLDKKQVVVVPVRCAWCVTDDVPIVLHVDELVLVGTTQYYHSLQVVRGPNQKKTKVWYHLRIGGTCTSDNHLYLVWFK